jgi:hypothetical protein
MVSPQSLFLRSHYPKSLLPDRFYAEEALLLGVLSIMNRKMLSVLSFLESKDSEKWLQRERLRDNSPVTIIFFFFCGTGA